ncbi:hypothetical protein [Streptomyces johnsoniae]|uniref:Lipoprotein n=1 Tax=Streptomyces johnsoniae TaxID=3075532 RepID=A0ABU2S3L5_9ACTN|nr:hypothetical protein [Streptomyces sp. DSM 41886]MDT0443388.1 hypothetical protein [Streptomyces sp. DSM 41886]
MRRSIRLAVPAVAAAALLLSGCGDDDDSGSPFSPGGNPGENQPEQGEEGGESGGGDQPPAEEGGDTGGGGGGAASDADFNGTWMLSDTMESSLTITDGDVVFVESTDAEGDVCYGEVSGGRMTVECSQFGSELFPDTEAMLSLDGSTLNVGWASGNTQTYESMGDMGEMPEMPEMPDMEDMPSMPPLEDSDLGDFGL